jgi:methyltransferase (TIGR00027 family)
MNTTETADGSSGKVSETAANMALIRALETLKAPDQRLFSDPFARRFLPFWQRVLLLPACFSPWRRFIEAIFDSKAPGARTSGAARTRLIDDWTREAVRDGLQQVVIMGAGFDCRPLRLGELLATSIIELDRPQMIALKSRLLADAQAGQLVRATIDFLREKPEQRLGEAGYAPNTKTLFIWEGVTNYLDATSVDATFETFASAAPGSRVIFTYVHADAISGEFPAPGLVHLLARLRRIREAWTFGFRPEALLDYLTRRGFRLIADLSAAEYRARYRPSVGHSEGYEFYRAALAEKGSSVSNSTH